MRYVFALAFVIAGACGRLGFDRISGSDAVAIVCPPAYSPAASSASCYRVVLAPADWISAEQSCEADTIGAHLAYAAKADERTELRSLVTTSNTQWVGVTERITAGIFLTVTGAPAMYLPWSAGAPGAGPCVHDFSAGWQTTVCTTKLPYVCQYDAVAADPTAY